jgi:hypothetical protein
MLNNFTLIEIMVEEGNCVTLYEDDGFDWLVIAVYPLGLEPEGYIIHEYGE